MTLNCTAIKDTRERPCRKEGSMQHLNLQLFAGEETTPVMAENSTGDAFGSADNEQEQQESTNDSQESAAGENGDNGSPASNEPFRVFQTREEYQSYFDDIMGKRLKGARETSEKLEKLSPIVEMLGKKYGTSDENELASKLREEVIAANAFNEGMTEAQYREKLENEEKIRTMEQKLGDFQHRQFLSALQNDVAKLAQEKPGLYGKASPEELAGDQRFLALLAQGFSVKEAYDALHISELLQQSAQEAGKQVVDNIVARGERPAESAAVSATAGNVTFDVSKMSDDEIEALAKRAMRGERIQF